MVDNYSRNVFINCPFDNEYKRLFNAMIFAIHDAGLFARCTLEITDSTENRIDKINKIISQCRYGINDISRIELDSSNNFPRFNMPFELGLFIGCKKFGDKIQRTKSSLIMDEIPDRYQKFLSDIKAFDIKFHYNSEQYLIKCVRDWLQGASGFSTIPDYLIIYERYQNFLKDCPLICERLKKNKFKELTFIDLQNLIFEWLNINENT